MSSRETKYECRLADEPSTAIKTLIVVSMRERWCDCYEIKFDSEGKKSKIRAYEFRMKKVLLRGVEVGLK